MKEHWTTRVTFIVRVDPCSKVLRACAMTGQQTVRFAKAPVPRKNDEPNNATNTTMVIINARITCVRAE